MELDTDKSISHDFKKWEEKWWGGMPDEVEEVDEPSEDAVLNQIVNDVIDVMANANSSRYNTLNWLLVRLLTGKQDEIEERRDDLMKVLFKETADYIGRA